MKRWLSAILMLVLLIQALPLMALAAQKGGKGAVILKNISASDGCVGCRDGTG